MQNVLPDGCDVSRVRGKVVFIIFVVSTVFYNVHPSAKCRHVEGCRFPPVAVW